ncbi:hypothetical protein ACFQX7_21070 [Luedemannella flava]
MNALLSTLTEAELALVRESERDSIVDADEDTLVDLHTRVRRARNKYVGMYRRQASARVAEHGGRGKARPKNLRNAEKAEIFEDALALGQPAARRRRQAQRHGAARRAPRRRARGAQHGPAHGDPVRDVAARRRPAGGHQTGARRPRDTGSRAGGPEASGGRLRGDRPQTGPPRQPLTVSTVCG